MEIPFPKSKFEYNLEALRGFAALIVVLLHCSDYSNILNGTVIPDGLWNYKFPGHLAVLVFFLLSGYVIGLTTKQLTWQTAGLYLKKRFLRLYPIYIVGILLVVLTTQNQYSLGSILSNLFFLQRVTAPPLAEIGVNWSLNYEVLFYLLFIPLSIFAIKPIHAFFGSLAVAFFFQLIIPVHLLAMYGFGFCFWVLGWWLSQTNLAVPKPTSRYALTGLLCLLLAFTTLNFVHDFMHYQLHLDTMRGPEPSVSNTDIMFSDFSYIPLGILLITIFTNKRIRYSSWLTAFVLLVPLFNLFLQLYRSRAHPINWKMLLIPYLLYAVGTVLLGLSRRQVSTENNLLPKFMVELGGVSYSVYLLHLLILVLIGRIPYFYGLNVSFLVRASVVIVFALIAGYLLEKVWQPFAVRNLKKLGF
jgi:peptidoglycan/LPS O-acetylase OafA/YrhL